MLGSADRQLGLAFKKQFLTDSDVSLKVRGILNTQTAECEAHGALTKVGREQRGPMRGCCGGSRAAGSRRVWGRPSTCAAAPRRAVLACRFCGAMPAC